LAADWPAYPESLNFGQVHLLEVLGRYTIAAAEGWQANSSASPPSGSRSDRPRHPRLGAVVAAGRLGVPCFRYSHGTQDVFKVEYRITTASRCRSTSNSSPLRRRPAHRAAVVRRHRARACSLEPSSLPSRWLGALQRAGRHTGRADPTKATAANLRHLGLVVPNALGAAAGGLDGDVLAAAADLGTDVLVLMSQRQVDSLGAPPPGSATSRWCR